MRALRLLTLRLSLCLSVALLAGCSGDATSSSGATASSTGPATAPTSSAPSTVAPNGTTVPGTVLRLGKRAVVRWRADKAHDSLVALTVTAVKRGKIKDLRRYPLNDAAKASSVYYVSVAVRNLGGGNLSGKTLTLYGQVSRDLVVQPVVFTLAFDRCNNRPLPAKFTKGAKAHECIVMLAPNHGKVTAIQWRGAGRTEPITWRVS